MATDINHSGSLRYRSLYLYAITNSHETDSSGWRTALKSMGDIYRDLVNRHPAETADIREAWKAFYDSLETSGRVSWATAEHMRIEADALTNTLNADAVRRSILSDQLFWLGTLSLALSLPLSLHLIRRLEISQDENTKLLRSLEQVSSRFQDLFQNTPTACFVYDREGRITDWNKAAVGLFEKTTDSVLGTFLWDSIARPSRRDSARESVRKLLAGEPLPPFDWIYETPNHISKTVVSSVIPLYTYGVITGGISVSTDVTAYRAAEESERALIADLAESEEHLRNVTSRSCCLLWEADVTVRNAAPGYVGPFWDVEKRTIFHWDLHVLHEEEASSWLPIRREPGQPFGQAWQASLSEDEAIQRDLHSHHALIEGNTSYSQEFPCRLANGSIQWLLENVELRRVEGAKLHWHLVGVCTDISERKASEEKLKTLAVELQRSNASLQEFAYIASHDLKEPLRKIQTFGRIVQKRSEDLLPADCVDYLTRMVTASVRMQTLVEGLLDYARASRKPKALVQVDLNETLRGVLSDLEEQISAMNGRVIVGNLPAICSDAMQMGQLFQNLVSNGLKFHKPGEEAVVTIAWDNEDTPVQGTLGQPDTVQITVSDNGIGFDQRYADHIFEIFEQLNSGAQGSQGTGVGLTICRTIVERYGGSISVNSEPGQGARFTIVLPTR